MTRSVESYFSFFKKSIPLRKESAKLLNIDDDTIVQEPTDELKEIFHLEEEYAAIKGNELPLEIAVVGSFSTGKSTFINSIIGEPLLGMDVLPATAKVCVLGYGEELAISAAFTDETRQTLSLEEFTELSVHNHSKNKKRGSSVGRIKAEIDHIEILYPAKTLRRLSIIDTPGFSSRSEVDDSTTKLWLSKADLLLWVFDVNKGTIGEDELLLLQQVQDKDIVAILNFRACPKVV